MSTGLISISNEHTQLATDDKHFKDLAGGNSFLPRIQLYTGASGVCKSGQFPSNNWGLVRNADQIEDLGKSVEVIPLFVRFKALDCNGDVRSYFDPNTEAFQKVKTLSAVKDSNCMCGVEFLLWLPEQSEFCTFFAHNKSSKQEADKIRSLINASATLTSRFVPNKKDSKKSFQAPVCNKSSTPPASLPSGDDTNEQIDRFKNAQDSKVQDATEAEAAATDRVQ